MWRELTLLSSWLSGPARLPILFFHRVLGDRDPLLPSEPTASDFEKILDWVGSQFRVLSLGHAVQLIRSGSLPHGVAAITFDDGYADNYEIAAEILSRKGMPATFFIATGFLGGGIMFNDIVIESIRRTVRESVRLPGLALGRLDLRGSSQRRGAIDSILAKLKYRSLDERVALTDELVDLLEARLPTDLMMTREQVQALHRRGFEIGAHTVNHPILECVADEVARMEIAEGRNELERIVGGPIDLFAFPNGRMGRDFSHRHVEMVRRQGFVAAFTTDPGCATVRSDMCTLPRFTPWDQTPQRFKLRMIVNMVAHA